jgi:hypothetical protein
VSASKKPRRMWVVLRALPWSSLEHYGRTLPDESPPGEPFKFLPVFKTKKDARRKFPGVCDHEIVALSVGGTP